MRLTRALFCDISKSLEYYSKFNPSPLSIKKFIEFGASKCERKSFKFLRKELLVRVANIMQELHLLPTALLQTPSLTLIREWYKQSFNELLIFGECKDDDNNTLENFCDTLIRIRNRHSNIVPTMAQGIIELKNIFTIDLNTENRIQYFLNRFYMCRISIRMLINQHASLFGNEIPSHPRHIGCIDPNCDINAIILDAYENARYLCDQYYLASPDLIIEQVNANGPNCPITIVAVPSHVHHIFFELFKNSMRAVVEYHTNVDDINNTFPPIHVTLYKGKEDLSIKISDKGGGIPRSLSGYLFNYMFSSLPRPLMIETNMAPFAGFGYGLPLSRLYARYFNGDLILNSYEGYGTDVIVYLKALSSEANELLPVFNKTSIKHYRDVIGNNDWSSGNQGANLQNITRQSRSASYF